jgi:hypothetical protein
MQCVCLDSGCTFANSGYALANLGCALGYLGCTLVAWAGASGCALPDLGCTLVNLGSALMARAVPSQTRAAPLWQRSVQCSELCSAADHRGAGAAKCVGLLPCRLMQCVGLCSAVGCAVRWAAQTWAVPLPTWAAPSATWDAPSWPGLVRRASPLHTWAAPL